MPEFFAENIPYSFSNLVKNASLKKDVNSKSISFLDVWKDLVELLQQSERKNWISFDAHGWVVSFDKNLINLQKKAINDLPESEYKKEKRLKLLDDLGCTGIESSHSSLLNSFYKRIPSLDKRSKFDDSNERMQSSDDGQSSDQEGQPVP